MDLLTGIKERRSIRRYRDERVSHDVINEIVEAARFAPSWKNVQAARYHIIEDRRLIDKIADDCTYNFEFNMGTIKNASALVVMSYINKRSGYERDGGFTTSKGNQWEMFDTGIAAQTFCLAAYAKGVGTCILGIFDDEKVKEAVGIPENETVGCLITIGYPDGTQVTAPKRKETEDLIEYI